MQASSFETRLAGAPQDEEVVLMVRSIAIAGAACVHLAAMRCVSNHEARVTKK